MDLVERYLQSLRSFLPLQTRDDIVNELREDIRSAMDDQEAHLGRTMTEDEIANMLKLRGHPFLLAQQYRTRRYLLIGPSLVPFYWQTLRTVLALAFLIFVVVTGSMAASGAPPAELLGDLAGFARTGLYIFAVVTLVFVGLDMAHARLHLFDVFNPRALPPLSKERDRGPGGGSLAELVGTGVFLVWVLAIPHYPWIMLGPAAAFVTFSTAWRSLYVALTMPLILSFLLQVTALVRPQWRWIPRWRRLITNLVTLAVLRLLFAAGPAVMAAEGATVSGDAVKAMNLGVLLFLKLTLVVVVVQIGLDALRLLRRTPWGVRMLGP